MLTNLMKMIVARTGMKSVVLAGVLGLSPAAAFADHIHVGFDFRHGRPHIEIRDVPPPVPVYEQREVRVWVEPVYRTVIDRQWVAPVYQTATDRVWVPDRFEFRDVVGWQYGRRVIYRERVLVQPGHYEDVSRQVLVADGHWENVERQEMVTPGHYETRIENVPVAVGPVGPPPPVYPY